MNVVFLLLFLLSSSSFISYTLGVCVWVYEQIYINSEASLNERWQYQLGYNDEKEKYVRMSSTSGSGNSTRNTKNIHMHTHTLDRKMKWNDDGLAYYLKHISFDIFCIITWTQCSVRFMRRLAANNQPSKEANEQTSVTLLEDYNHLSMPSLKPLLLLLLLLLPRSIIHRFLSSFSWREMSGRIF